MSTDADRDTVQTKPDECFLSMQVNPTLNKCNLTHAYLTAIFNCENDKWWKTEASAKFAKVLT